MKNALRWVLSIFMVSIGIAHFVFTGDFVPMVPPWLPAPVLLVYVSGVAEIAGGVGLRGLVALRCSDLAGGASLGAAAVSDRLHRLGLVVHARAVTRGQFGL